MNSHHYGSKKKFLKNTLLRMKNKKVKSSTLDLHFIDGLTFAHNVG
jgi:hypothetical protein